VAETMEALHREGFVDLVDYDARLSGHEDLLRLMVENDLQSARQWSKALKESHGLWNRFIATLEPGHIEVLEEYQHAA
jgi:hypothetical protein